MAQLIVRRLDDSVKQKLKARAKRKGVSLEAEARAILEKAAEGERPPKRSRGKKKGFGTLMHERFKDVGLTDAEWKLFNEGIEEIRRGSTVKPVDFEK
jgi:plasmid stability protein